MIWPVILSGGAGTRLWPLSRAAMPKQLLALAGEHTMLQATALRTANADGFAAPVVVANAAHLDIVRDQLAAIGLPAAALILEPAGRNTAPAIALAAHWVEANDPDGVMLVMPSDHVIADVPAFHRAIAAALPPVRDDRWLATFGIAPDAPETGYGYIEIGDPLAPGVNVVRRFVEKPDRATAEAWLASGGYAWNGGIFLMRGGDYLAALQRHAPAIAAAAARSFAGAAIDGDVIRPDAEAFAACPAESIDYAVMEKHDKVAVASVAMGWSDIGSWDALHALLADDDGNAVRGDVIAIDTGNSLLRSDGPLLTVIGLDGVCVVATGDAVLVAAKGRSQEVKGVVERLAAAERREHLDSFAISSAWGSERRLIAGDAVSVAELTVNPGAAIPDRARPDPIELTVASGHADLSLGPDRHRLAAGESWTIPGGQTHRVGNAGDAPLRLIELRFHD